jgi:hypothetical protein
VKLTRQRVFVGDNAAAQTVELAPGASAGAVLTQLDERGAFATWTGSGGWMLFEVAADYGMERPLRTFERVEDVVASWHRERTANTLVARLTPYAGVLSRQALPDAPPLHAGWVEYEAKRGKWAKRWLALRPDGLYVGKREGGRGAELLCLLASFDAYVVTTPAKAPRAAVFAVKSTESLAFFEDAADYLHLFSVDEHAAEFWTQKIWLARVSRAPSLMNAPADGVPAVLCPAPGARRKGARERRRARRRVVRCRHRRQRACARGDDAPARSAAHDRAGAVPAAERTAGPAGDVRLRAGHAPRRRAPLRAVLPPITPVPRIRSFRLCITHHHHARSLSRLRMPILFLCISITTFFSSLSLRPRV